MGCQATPISGFRLTTLQNMVLFAAVLFKNINEALLAAGGPNAFANAVNPNMTWIDQHGSVAVPQLLGATKGGVTIRPALEITPLEIDSVRVPLEGLNIVNRATPEIQGNPVEIGDPNILSLMMGPASVTITNGMAKIQQRLNICDEDYFGNIAAVGQCSRTGAYMVVILRGAFVVAPGEIATQDGQQANPQVTWRGHGQATNPTEVPMVAYEPVFGS